MIPGVGLSDTWGGTVRLVEGYHYYGGQGKIDESIHISQHDL